MSEAIGFLPRARGSSLLERDPGHRFLRVPRVSRIYFGGKFFLYPIRPWNALFGLGLLKSLHVLLSYLRVRIRPLQKEEYFEPFVINRFGRALYELFFRNYTEKVWGIPCTEIRAEWAAQRIKGLSLLSAALHSLHWRKNIIKSLVEEFHYPVYGPGLMWEEVQKRVQESGNPVHLNTPVVKLYHDHSRVLEAEVQTHLGRRPVSARHFLSSVPLPRLIQMLDPPPPDPILEAASTLRYRDSITVNLIVNRASLFPDNWIYVHSDGARVARIQNYKNWSAAMVPDPETTSLGMEYFCFQGDDLWKRSSKQLIELAKKDLEILKLVHPKSH